MFKVFSFVINKIISNYVCIDYLGYGGEIKCITSWSTWVGRSKLKEVDINDLFKRKQMNEAMEAELTGIDSRTDNLAVTEEENVDEDIPIDLKK